MIFATTYWRSDTYTDDYVTALGRQFQRHGHLLTVLQPRHQIGRYKPKLEWFAPWNAHMRPAVVFDLDTFIVGDPAPFLGLDDSKLWLIRQFLSNTHLGESGIFVAPDDDALCERIWGAAQGLDPKAPDGKLLRSFPHEFIPDVIDGIVSYKLNAREQCPTSARVVCFHGRPRPAEAEGWAKDWWQSFLN